MPDIAICWVVVIGLDILMPTGSLLVLSSAAEVRDTCADTESIQNVFSHTSMYSPVHPCIHQY